MYDNDIAYNDHQYFPIWYNSFLIYYLFATYLTLKSHANELLLHLVYYDPIDDNEINIVLCDLHL